MITVDGCKAQPGSGRAAQQTTAGCALGDPRAVLSGHGSVARVVLRPAMTEFQSFTAARGGARTCASQGYRPDYDEEAVHLMKQRCGQSIGDGGELKRNAVS